MGVLFKRNPDIKQNAYPNWRRSIYPSSNFAIYSEMYKSGADLLISWIKDNSTYNADEVILPAIFLYRHSLELILKAILLTHYLMDDNMIREKIKDKLKGHSLKNLWNKSESIIRLYLSDSIKKDRKPLDLMKTAIEEMDLIDPSSMMFRYPYDNEYKDAQLIGDKKKSYGIDYKWLMNNFDEVYSYFSGCFAVIFEQYERLEPVPVL
jgi:hypothetical protein